MLKLDDKVYDYQKKELVDLLLSSDPIIKYILGRNQYAEQLSKIINIEAFIDDFTDDTVYLGKPVLKIKK